MIDRQPTKPNRYAVYDDNHNFIRYEYHERADEPTQVGDALNKANLLPDDVATALGLTGNPQVKDALEKIKTLIDGKAIVETFSYTGTGTFGSSNPMSFTFNGIPKLVVVTTVPGSVTYRGAYWLCGMLSPSYADKLAAMYSSSGISREAAVHSKLDENTILWYSTTNADQQLNSSAVQYTIWALY